MASLALAKNFDDRTPLQRAHRHELLAFARANGVKEIRHDMPSPLMIKILERYGYTNIQVYRTLGEPERGTSAPTQALRGHPVPEQPTAVITADELLERQWAQHVATPPEADTTDKPSMAWLRAECKRRDIKQPRGASAEMLMDLLQGA